MGYITVVPENLRFLSAQLKQVVEQMRTIEVRMGSALGNLNWAVRQKVDVDNQTNHAYSQACALATRAEEMARYLERKAQAFEEADGQGVCSVQKISTSFVQWLSGAQMWLGFPSQEANTLGAALGQPYGVQAARLPVAGGATVVGLASLIPLSEAFSRVEDFGERVWNWLRRRGWSTNEELEAASEVPQSRLGELLDQENQADEKPDSQAQSDPEPKTTTKADPEPQVPPDQPTRSEWWHDVPIQSQRDLKYKKQKTDYGCTPTATSMILDYWHAQDPTNKTMSAQELLDVNADQGVFSATGMSASHILDEVTELGYGVTDVHMGSNLDSLREAVSQGPVLALVKLGMKTKGTNHAVVVTGVSDDGQQVRVNDPWTGQAHTYAWEDFSKSWGADFGRDAKTNNFVAIRP